MGCETGLRETPDMLEHAVDVHTGAVDWLFAKHLHPVDQGADAIGLIADQHRQFAVAVGHGVFE
jgi:hypothetical protein